MSALNSFGKPAYGAGGNYPKNFKIKGDEKDPNAVNKSTYRFLPPMHNQVGNPKGWKVFQKIHYGYSGVDLKEAGKTRARPFVCPRDQDFRTKMIRVDCPECCRIEGIKEKLEAVTTQVKGLPAAEQATRLGPLKEWLRKHNLQAKWKVNVLDVEGQAGDLLVSHRTMKDVDTLFQTLAADGIDPLGPDQGVWVEFTRTGNGFTNPDKVAAVKTRMKVDGVGLVEQVKLAPLTEELAKVALGTCRDLGDTTPAVSLTQDLINLLCSCDGSPEEVDRIFAMSQSAGAPPARPATPAQTYRAEPWQDVNTTMEVVTKAVSAAEVVEDDDEEAAALAALAAAKAKKAAKVAQASAAMAAQEQRRQLTEQPVAQAKPAPAAVQKTDGAGGVAGLSDEDFAAMYPELMG